MRVFLDENEEGVFIRDFSADSPAEAAGIRKDDRIASIDGHPVRYFVDVKLLMLDKRPGDEVEVVTTRESLIMGEQSNVSRFKLGGEAMRHHAG
jgi:S1-C subfamily serine protease